MVLWITEDVPGILMNREQVGADERRSEQVARISKPAGDGPIGLPRQSAFSRRLHDCVCGSSQWPVPRVRPEPDATEARDEDHAPDGQRRWDDGIGHRRLWNLARAPEALPRSSTRGATEAQWLHGCAPSGMISRSLPVGVSSPS